VIDIWSLGCVILEIICGVPLWMSLKTIINFKGQDLIRTGLFATKGRVFESIISRQTEVANNIDDYLDKLNLSGITVDEDLKYLIKRMLCLDPKKRISPKEIQEFLHSRDPTLKDSEDKFV